MEDRSVRGVRGRLIADLTVTLLRVHREWAWVVILCNGAAGLWGLAAHRLHRLRGRPFWIATGIAEGFIAVQVVLGTLLLQRGVRPSSFHIFYGVLLVVGPTLAWVYRSEPAVKKRVYLFYGAAGLFFMGLAIRAMLTVHA